jgi:hypothetical protein
VTDVALSDDEIRLIGRLTADSAETARRFRQQGLVILIGSFVVAGVAALRAIWFLIPITLGLGGGIYWLGRVAARKTSPERAAPVLLALREAPERVRTIQHSITSDSRRIFVSHWVEVKTDDGLLKVKADDWRELMSALARRCPSARTIS